MEFKSYICVYIVGINETHTLIDDKFNREIAGIHKIYREFIKYPGIHPVPKLNLNPGNKTPLTLPPIGTMVSLRL